MEGLPAEVIEERFKALAGWAVDVRAWLVESEAWGENVRRDILRLERHLGFPEGDPGPPPPPPPVPDLLQSLADLGTKPTPPPATSKK